MSNFKHFGKKLFFSIQNDQTLRKISYSRMIWTDLRNILSVRPPLYGKKQVAFKWIFRWFYAFWDPIFLWKWTPLLLKCGNVHTFFLKPSLREGFQNKTKSLLDAIISRLGYDMIIAPCFAILQCVFNVCSMSIQCWLFFS